MINKKISIFIGALTSGGAERVISIISKELLKYFKEVEIVVYADKPIFYDIDKRIKIIILEKETKTRNILKNMLWYRKYIKKQDIILSFLAHFNIFVIISLLMKKNIILVADRADPKFVPQNIILRKIRDFLYNFATGICCQTQKNKEYFSRKLQNKIDVIYNPVYNLNKKLESEVIKKENIVVTVGRLVEQKNHKLLIRAFKLVLDKKPEYKLEIFGEGNKREELENYIENLNLKGKVILKGAVKDIYKQIKRAKAFILTSKYEGMSNALLEALIIGVPCISTKVSGATDLIKNGINGILVDSNEEEIAKSILFLIDNEEEAKKLSLEALKLQEELEIENIMRKWMTFIMKYIS